MKIASHLPELNVAEIERCWMTPGDLCDLAAVGDSERPEVRRFLSNISDRGLLPFVKSGSGKTAPKLYSCVGAIALRTFWEIVSSGRTYEFAAPIAHHVAALAGDLVRDLRSINDLDTINPDWLVTYVSGRHGQPTEIRTIRSESFDSTVFGHAYDHGVFCAGSVIWNVLRNYADPWARDRMDRGLDAPGDRYRGCDDEGMPLDPNHPWNADLPPLERARRRVEIEEYIERKRKEAGE